MGGVPIRLGDVATIQIGPEMRRGVAELNGQGEVAGGVVILRSGKNARPTIAAVKDKLAELKKSLPPGVETVKGTPCAFNAVATIRITGVATSIAASGCSITWLRRS